MLTYVSRPALAAARLAGHASFQAGSAPRTLPRSASGAIAGLLRRSHRRQRAQIMQNHQNEALQ
eukprot:4958028-Alexandrium_andersonii.AAC.1